MVSFSISHSRKLFPLEITFPQREEAREGINILKAEGIPNIPNVATSRIGCL